jgi:ribosome biogenesis GTPase
MNTGRITREDKTTYTVNIEGKDHRGEVRGSFFLGGGFPKVGDFVEVSPAGKDRVVIESIVERTSVLARKGAHTGKKQILATNVDLILIVMGLDGDFNRSRLERYLLLAKSSKIEASIVLNKSDKNPKADELKVSLLEEFTGNEIHVVSAKSGKGMEGVSRQCSGATVVLIGSSGAGKSTITNWLLGTSAQETGEVRKDDRGRHTTTTRQLFFSENGGSIIDSPGIRELEALSDSEAVQEIFQQIQTIAKKCKFYGCEHRKTKGCNVLDALEKDIISKRQLYNYHKLLKEQDLARQGIDHKYIAEKRKRESKEHKRIKSDDKRRRY